MNTINPLPRSTHVTGGPEMRPDDLGGFGPVKNNEPDLLPRLHDSARGRQGTVTGNLLVEAAAEIERLRAEREAVVAEAMKYAGKSGRLEAKVKRLSDTLRLIESAKDRGFGIEYVQGVVQSTLRDHEERILLETQSGQ